MCMCVCVCGGGGGVADPMLCLAFCVLGVMIRAGKYGTSVDYVTSQLFFSFFY